jgi:two-component system, NtrC family, sensor kinase
MKPVANSIQQQVLLFTFAVSIGVLLPVGTVLFINHFSQFKLKLSDSLQATARVFASNAAAALAFDDRDAAVELIASLSNDPSIAAAALYTQNGTRFATYGITPFSPPEAQATDGFASTIVSVAYKGEPFGQLYLLSRYPSQLRQTVEIWAFVYTAGIIFAAVLAMFLANRFKRAVAFPLHSLARLASEVTANKNYTTRVTPQGPAEIRELAEAFNAMLAEVGRRDAALAEKSETLARQLDTLKLEILTREAAEERLRDNNRDMMRLSREAGMAEVATGVLHNIGNALNSINVSTELLLSHVCDQARSSVATMCEFFTHPSDKVSAVFNAHPTGPDVREFATSLAKLTAEQIAHASNELAALRLSVAHLKDIVARQQSLARNTVLFDTFDLRDAAQDALLLNKFRGHLSDPRLEQLVEGPTFVHADRTIVVQILVNLIANARAAMEEMPPANRHLRIHIAPALAGNLAVSITDNGCGIPAAQLVSIFSYGYTTKADGHGFGLHNAANAARLMGGSLQVRSVGLGHGATFIFTLPTRAPVTA